MFMYDNSVSEQQATYEKLFFISSNFLSTICISTTFW